MKTGGGNILSKALEYERKALDFYCDAQTQCESQLGEKMFSLLTRDKLRMVTKLAEIHSAMCQGMSLEKACALTEDDIVPQTGLDCDPAPITGNAASAIRHDADYLDDALSKQKGCLDYFEGALRRAKDPRARSFLRQALEDEQGHRVLLLDLRSHCEQAVENLEH